MSIPSTNLVRTSLDTSTNSPGPISRNYSDTKAPEPNSREDFNAKAPGPTSRDFSACQASTEFSLLQMWRNFQD